MYNTYNVWLVALSLIVALVASFTALEVAARIPDSRGVWRRRWWLGSGALAMGIGFWAMHFVGMLAISMPTSLSYHWPSLAGSFAISVVAAGAALFLLGRTTVRAWHLAVASLLIGLGISGLHYTGMSLLQMHVMSYMPGLLASSIVIAVGASFGALWLVYSPHTPLLNPLARRFAGAVLLMMAVAGMHYVGMAAAGLPNNAVCCTSQSGAYGLALSIGLVSFAVFGVTIVLSRLDSSKTRLLGSVSRLNGQVVRLSTMDPLTDLPNRSTLTEYLSHALDAAGRGSDLFAVLALDLDDFKTINESFGHAQGDQVLVAFAARLRQCVRGGDLIARVGADQFVVVLERLHRQQEALLVAERILARMREPLWVGGLPLRVMPSIGIAMYPQHGGQVDMLLKRAAAAMNVAKQAGRQMYRVYETAMEEVALRSLEIQRVLIDAPEAGYLSLNYQPKYDAASGALVGAEALIRLQHPVLGLLLPMEFLPVVERTGQIVDIGYWVVREVCRQMRTWEQEGLPVPRVSINLSNRQLRQVDVVTAIADLVRDSGVAPQDLLFELAESAAMQDAPHSIDVIAGFRELGFEVALDRFGVGQSSMTYLPRFAVSQIKLDRFFTNGLDSQGEAGRAVVSSLISLGHALRMEVVAEGVESLTQLEQLKALGCDQVQGFLLSLPLDARAFGELLRSRTTTT